MKKAKFYQVTKKDIAPFSFKNLASVPGDDFIKLCKNYDFTDLKWGDAIQYENEDRNNNKYYWDNGWKSMDYQFMDYGSLPQPFSVIDKNLPIDYFQDTIDYNEDIIPWTPTTFSKEIIINATRDNLTFSTFFIWNNKKCFIEKYIPCLETIKNKLMSFGQILSDSKDKDTGKPYVIIDLQDQANPKLPRFMKERIRHGDIPGFCYFKHRIAVYYTIKELWGTLVERYIKKHGESSLLYKFIAYVISSKYLTYEAPFQQINQMDGYLFYV